MESMETQKNSIQNKLDQTSPLVLAFIGDSVHTLFVRENIIKEGIHKLNDYNKSCNFLCRAKTQSKVLDKLEQLLTIKEQELVRRTRNAKNHHTAKNSNLVDYKKATCFEALVGYLYLNGETQRLEQFLKISIEERK